MKAFIVWNKFYGHDAKAVYFAESSSKAKRMASSALLDCGMTRADVFGGMMCRREPRFDGLSDTVAQGQGVQILEAVLKGRESQRANEPD